MGWNVANHLSGVVARVFRGGNEPRRLLRLLPAGVGAFRVDLVGLRLRIWLRLSRSQVEVSG